MWLVLEGDPTQRGTCFRSKSHALLTPRPICSTMHGQRHLPRASPCWRWLFLFTDGVCVDAKAPFFHTALLVTQQSSSLRSASSAAPLPWPDSPGTLTCCSLTLLFSRVGWHFQCVCWCGNVIYTTSGFGSRECFIHSFISKSL